MKLEHVIGRDGLHRLRLTGSNGEITDNSHEGLDQRHSALRNLRLKLTSYLHLGGFPGNAAEHLANSLVDVMLNNDIPTVDERVRKTGINRRSQCCNADADDLGDGEHFQCQKCRRECSTMTVDERVQRNDCHDGKPQYREPEADPLRHERVFGKPADPFEPQTPGPVEPQLR